MNDIEDTKLLCSMLIKIAENCFNNLPIQQYVFIRMEEILGLTPDVENLAGDLAKEGNIKSLNKSTNLYSLKYKSKIFST